MFIICVRWKISGAHDCFFLFRKGELKPISIVIKLRQGRKACTLITNFEAFLLDANVLADELQKLCASSTTGAQSK